MVQQTPVHRGGFPISLPGEDRCRKCDAPLDASSGERTWENACPQCRQPVWLSAGDLAVGTIVRIIPWGVIVELAPGVEGQIHVSELSEKPLYHPKEAVSVGDQIRARVVNVDPWTKRIVLSGKGLDDGS